MRVLLTSCFLVDAVLSGPSELSEEALSSVLGVSHNTLTRVRRLADRINQEAVAAREEHKMRLVLIIFFEF